MCFRLRLPETGIYPCYGSIDRMKYFDYARKAPYLRGPRALSKSTPTLDPWSKSKGWKGKPDEEIVVTLTEEGIYMYQCDPHKPMAMVGVIQVGKATNLDEAKKEAANYSKSLPMNKDRLTKYLDQAK